MGEDFTKHYVCLYHHWNPYSEEIKNIPDIYWAITFQMMQMQMRDSWDRYYKPNAELAASIIKPEIFKAYRREERRVKRTESLKAGEEIYEETQAGISGAGEANSHYDPNKGLVDENGKIIIPKEQYEKMIGISGVAVSY